MEKRAMSKLHIAIYIISGLIILIGAFVILFNYNLSFKQQIISIYYNLVSDNSLKEYPIISCQDEEPSANYFSKGAIKITRENNLEDIYADICQGNSLREYSCELNQLKTEDYECDSGCFDGACIYQSETFNVFDSNLSQSCQEYRITSPLNAVAQNEYGAYFAINAIDGDLSTNWFGNPESPYPKWIYFDFADKVCISELDIYAYKEDIPITGNIQASQDAVRWANILTNITLSSQNQTFILPPNIVARYIRLYETSSSRSYGSLSDVRFKIADVKE